LYNSKELENDKEKKQGHGWPPISAISAAAQGVTYIILNDFIFSCPSLSNYTYVLYMV